MADECAMENRACCRLAMPTLLMLETRIVRELVVDEAAGSAEQAHLSAASGLVKLGNRLFVVADDENHLAMFDLSNREPSRLVPIFDGRLPLRHKARKAAKPDCEALLVLPAFAGYPHGALMAMGSGSRPSRQRGALWHSTLLPRSRGLHAPLTLRHCWPRCTNSFLISTSRVRLSKATRSLCFSAATVAQPSTHALT